MTNKSYSNCPSSVEPTSSVTYGYDAHSSTNYGIGFRTSMTDGTSTTPTRWEYDERGRLAREIKHIDNQSFTTIFTYNSADLPTTMTYPDGEVVTTAYNNRMLPISATGNANYASSMVYDSADRMTSRALGNGLTQKYLFNPWNVEGGRLDKIVAGSGTWNGTTQLFATTIQKLSYGYDNVGNVTQIAQVVNFSNNQTETQNFGYDSLNRLTSWTLDGVMEEYLYDSQGNLDVKNGLDLEYEDVNHVHAVTHIGSTQKYWYDQNGNQVTRIVGLDTYTLVYDAENRMTEVKKNDVTMAQFTYNGDGQRVKSVVNSETIYFAGGHYEVKGNEITKHYFAGASRIAVRKYIVPQSTTLTYTTLTYLLGDHLGSTSLAVDASTGDVVETRYKPWGEVRFTTEDLTEPIEEITLPTRYTFTGQYSHMNDDATDLGAAGFGLMFYNARWYDPMTGRMAQADTIVPGGVQGLDRYAYVNNSPVNYVDPTGHRCADNEDRDEDIWGYCTTSWSDEARQIVINLHKLGLWGNGQAAMVYLLATELGPGNIDDPDKLNGAQEAITRRYWEFCKDGPWSEKCVQSFWGYPEGIINPDSQKAKDNYQAVLQDPIHLANANTLAGEIINPSKEHKNWKDGCTDKDTGTPQVCGWATIESGQLYNCLLNNNGCWPQNPNEQQFAFGNTAYVTWLYPSNAAFIVLTVNEQEALCSQWGLPDTCSLLEIP